MKCCTMDCYSEAVATAGEPDRNYCIECAIAVTKQWGPGCLETIEGSIFPWDAEVLGICDSCGGSYSKYLIGLTNDCPKCRRPLPDKKLEEWKKVNVKYMEGEHD